MSAVVERAATRSLPRDMTRVHVFLPGRDDVERAIGNAVKLAIGDWKAEVSIRMVDGEGDFVIVVKQAHATWWAPMPDTLAEQLSDWDGRFTLRWNGSEPPAEVEE